MNTIQVATTYTSGFTLKPTRDITKNDIYNICKDLNNYFSTDYSFIPEPITEGGILFKKTPNKYNTNKAYKSMRFSSQSGRISWPCINEDEVMNEWKDNQDILFKKYMRNDHSTKIGTFLKAFCGADVWSLEELKIFNRVFEKNGIDCFSKMPSKKSLIEIWNVPKEQLIPDENNKKIKFEDEYPELMDIINISK